MKRCEIWTSASSTPYGGKPCPVVIIQHGHFEFLDSVTFCGFTRDLSDLPLFGVLFEPSELNGLEFPSCIMVDKFLTTPKTELRYRIGKLSDADIAQLNTAPAMFLGLIG